MASPDASENLLASIVIPVCDEGEAVRPLLAYLLSNSISSLQIVVVDDASRENLRDQLGVLDARVVLIRNQRKLGSAGSRNRGLSICVAPIVFFLDADCMPEPSWISRGLEAFEDPSIVGVEGDILYEDREPSVFSKVPINPFYPKVLFPVLSTPGVDYPAANVAYRRDLLLRLGGFRSELFRWGREDTDLGWRMRSLGRIAHAPEMRVIHRSGSWNLWSLLRNTKRYRDDVTFFRVHGDFPFRFGRILHPHLAKLLAMPWLVYRDRNLQGPRDVASLPIVLIYLLFARFQLWRSALSQRVLVL